MNKTTIGRNFGLHVIQYPSGRFGYVGRIPTEIAFDDNATPELVERGLKFGARFGAKQRTFNTKQDAIQFAAEKGYTIQ